MPDTSIASCFRLFNEIGIIEQLSRTLFEVRLPDGFGVPQFAVLNHLVRVKDGQTPLALARAFQVPKTSMTHTLALLERAELVIMRANPQDGRSKCVFITNAGRSFRLDAIAALKPDLERVAEVLDADDMAVLLPLLERLRQYLDANRVTSRETVHN
jgi:DNA-binding MarR family transcriptional regulator